MPGRILLFTGAPASGSLDWEQLGLLDDFSEPIARFASLKDQTPRFSASASSTHPAWRSLPLERQHLKTGLSQNHGWQAEYQGASFFITSEVDSFTGEQSGLQDENSHVSSSESAEAVLSQFYEHSFAMHEDIASSQIPTNSDAGTSFYNNGTTSFGATDSTSGSSAELRSSARAQEIPAGGHLSDLDDLPSAAYLHKIQPQIMSVNLIIGIISISVPRAINTRCGVDVELVEVLVGDETKSGFAINFWLSTSQAMEGDMKTILSGLRPQDIVLMRNIALSSFRGKVYGQSLRKEMTKVHLLYRNKIDRTDVGGCYSAADFEAGKEGHSQVEKTRIVREWVLRFVGVGVGNRVRKGKGKGRGFEAKEILPPDTQ